MDARIKQKVGRPKKSFWWIHSIGWMLVTLINIVFQTEYFTQNFDAIGYSFVITFTGFTVTFLARYVILTFRVVERPIGHMIPYLIVLTFIATSICVLTFSGLIVTLFSEQTTTLSEIIRNMFQFGLVVFIWILMYSGYLFLENQQRMTEEQLRLSLKLKEAELNNLRKQLSPHFLFNSLNNIHSLIRIDPEKARETILNISDLLRYVLNYQNKETVTLREEMEIVAIYMQLNSIHLDANVQFQTSIDEQLDNISLPPLSIQLLVENALKHGAISNQALVSVKGYEQDGKSIIEVSNPGKLDQKRAGGIGLTNLHHRLKAIFGTNVSIALFEKENTVISQIIISTCG